tara:strand:- start:28 stop:243 length:216 start_codon:yes stop_codon:yes gene_type:complete
MESLYLELRQIRVQIGDTFLIAGGGGEQIFKIAKITKQENIFGTKHSKRNPNGCLAKNHKLNPLAIIKRLT